MLIKLCSHCVVRIMGLHRQKDQQFKAVFERQSGDALLGRLIPVKCNAMVQTSYCRYCSSRTQLLYQSGFVSVNRKSFFFQLLEFPEIFQGFMLSCFKYNFDFKTSRNCLPSVYHEVRFNISNRQKPTGRMKLHSERLVITICQGLNSRIIPLHQVLQKN